MREEHYRPVPSITQQLIVLVTCDNCGKTISYDDSARYDGDVAHELCITLDGEQCVNFYRRRDYCDTCYIPVWNAINKLVIADPDTERDQEYGRL